MPVVLQYVINSNYRPGTRKQTHYLQCRTCDILHAFAATYTKLEIQ